jgi:hypothetical protein
MDHASRFRQNMRSNSTKCVRRIIPLQHWYPVRLRASPADPPRYCVLAAALQRVENRSMTVEVSLVERIEALSRSEFRAAVNAERRVTLAIGALVLHWGQFDSSPGSMIQWMREKHEALGLGGLSEEHPSDHGGRLKLLRKFIKACNGDPAHLAELDKLRERVSRNTRIHNDLVHWAMSLGNVVSFERGPMAS